MLNTGLLKMVQKVSFSLSHVANLGNCQNKVTGLLFLAVTFKRTNQMSLVAVEPICHSAAPPIGGFSLLSQLISAHSSHLLLLLLFQGTTKSESFHDGSASFLF